MGGCYTELCDILANLSAVISSTSVELMDHCRSAAIADLWRSDDDTLLHNVPLLDSHFCVIVTLFGDA